MLQDIVDLDKLKSLVHASPEYHQTYATFCQKTSSNIVLIEPQKRSVDLLQPTNTVEIAVPYTCPTVSSLKPVLEEIQSN